MMHGREKSDSHSSWEADEQSGPDRSGAGGSQGWGLRRTRASKARTGHRDGSILLLCGTYLIAHAAAA
jgi:hypothetical protein